MTDWCKTNLQRCCKQLREKWGNPNYPKGMMTAAQIAKRTATVNVAGESRVTHERCYAVLKTREFRLFLLNENAGATVERSGYGDHVWYHIRITFYNTAFYEFFSDDQISNWLAGGSL